MLCFSMKVTLVIGNNKNKTANTSKIHQHPTLNFWRFLLIFFNNLGLSKVKIKLKNKYSVIFDKFNWWYLYVIITAKFNIYLFHIIVSCNCSSTNGIFTVNLYDPVCLWHICFWHLPVSILNCDKISWSSTVQLR